MDTNDRCMECGEPQQTKTVIDQVILNGRTLGLAMVARCKNGHVEIGASVDAWLAAGAWLPANHDPGDEDAAR